MKEKEEIEWVKWWLDSIGLPRYTDLFLLHGYDSLSRLTEHLQTAEHLRELGVTMPGHIAHLLSRLELLRAGVFSVWDRLPPEVFVCIFGFLTPRQLSAVRLVSRRFNALATSEDVWRALSLRRFRLLPDAPQNCLCARALQSLLSELSRAPAEADLLAMRRPGERWIDVYRRLLSMSFLSTASHEQVALRAQGQVATHLGNGTHHAACTGYALEDDAYAEAWIVGDLHDNFSHSVGVAEGYVSSAWLEENGGIGWYLDGNVYLRGQRVPKKYAGWGKGDRVGVLLTAQAGERRLFLCKNGGADPAYIVLGRASPPKAKPLFFCVLMGGSESVAVRFGGSKLVQEILKAPPMPPDDADL